MKKLGVFILILSVFLVGFAYAIPPGLDVHQQCGDGGCADIIVVECLNHPGCEDAINTGVAEDGCIIWECPVDDEDEVEEVGEDDEDDDKEEDAQGGPIKYGECGDNVCNYGENTHSYPYYCPEDCEDTPKRNRMIIQVRNRTAHTELKITKTENKINAEFSNGKNAEIKIMPDTASENALERLRLKVCSSENNCTIELKEVGQGNQTRAMYEVQIERHSRILWIFQKKMRVRVDVDADTGEIDKVGKPWWAFLASEPDEE